MKTFIAIMPQARAEVAEVMCCGRLLRPALAGHVAQS
jgi:hypothetical protein